MNKPRAGRGLKVFWWPGAESNCRHADFQCLFGPDSNAQLPATFNEIRHLERTRAQSNAPDFPCQRQIFWQTPTSRSLPRKAFGTSGARGPVGLPSRTPCHTKGTGPKPGPTINQPAVDVPLRFSVSRGIRGTAALAPPRTKFPRPKGPAAATFEVAVQQRALGAARPRVTQRTPPACA